MFWLPGEAHPLNYEVGWGFVMFSFPSQNVEDSGLQNVCFPVPEGLWCHNWQSPVQNAPAIVQVAALHLFSSRGFWFARCDSEGRWSADPRGPGGFKQVVPWCCQYAQSTGWESPGVFNLFTSWCQEKNSSVHLFIPVIKCYKYDFLMLQKITWNIQLPGI